MNIMVVVPCMSMVHTGFLRSLVSLDTGQHTMRVAVTEGTLVYNARQTLLTGALKVGCDRILWLDSDMSFEPDTMLRLSKDLDEGREFVSGLYFRRKLPTRPILYDKIVENENGLVGFRVFQDYPRNRVFEIAGSGFGCVMMTADFARKMLEKWQKPFYPILGAGEDLAFCYRASQLGVKLYCDSSVKCGHLGIMEYSEDHFGEFLYLGGDHSPEENIQETVQEASV